MNGKELKVTENELKFGAKTRFVNVFGVFKYKPNSGLYVIYADVDTKNSYVCYGTAHSKNGNILCMHSNKPEDTEAVKEYIFKVINEEKLDDFELISLEEAKEIEIIASKNFEIKADVLEKLVEKTIPKKIVTEEIEKKPKKKKSPLVSILIILLLVLIGGTGYIYYDSIKASNNISKVIYCTKQYDHDELQYVTVDEEKTFKFDHNDILKELDVTTKFTFNNEEAYLDFINKNTFYKYMPADDDDTTGDFKNDTDNRVFITHATTKIDESYGDPVEYETILTNNNTEHYTCEEKIEK